ncbi:CDGSH iron-sulfur domain-containing protein [Nocardia sp. NPDC051990]|uniref:CDGSH iron-sulfur domain-containing protein n=1 Tax=Nocardia sp. NPDC051990 TaxID=3155285 RepID=UPI003422F778
MRNWWSSVPTDPENDRRTITYTAEGPALIEGPVELVTDDGRTIHCDRCVVALCLCRRSAIYPLCDTSHRKLRRTTR